MSSFEELSETETKVYKSIVEERERQKVAHHNDNTHNPTLWTALLAKQLGQASDQVIHGDNVIDVNVLYKQLTQLSALSVAWMELLEMARFRE